MINPIDQESLSPNKHFSIQICNDIWKWVKQDWFAILVFIFSALFAIYPVLSSFNEKIIRWAGDNVQYMYMTGWFAKALANFNHHNNAQ